MNTMLFSSANLEYNNSHQLVPAAKPAQKKDTLTLGERFKNLPDVVIGHIGPYVGSDFQTVSKRLYTATKGNKHTLGRKIGDILVSSAKVGLNNEQMKFIQANKEKATILDARFGNQLATDFPTAAQIQQTAESFPFVTEIRVSGKNVNNQLIDHLIQSFPNLRSLSITNSSALTNHAVSRIALHFPNLVNLQLSGCTALTNDALAELRNNAPNLRRLDISKCPKVSDFGIRHLTHKAAMRYLKTSHFYGVNQAFAHLRQNNPLLVAEEEAAGKAMRCWHYASDSMRTGVQTFNQYRNYALTAAGVAAFCGLIVLASNHELARKAEVAAKQGRIEQQVATAVRECETTFAALPEARGERHCFDYAGVAEVMKGMQRSQCTQQSYTPRHSYTYAEGSTYTSTGGSIKPYLPLCKRFAPTNPEDTSQQRQYLQKRIEKEISQQRDYQLEELDKSIKKMHKLVGKEVLDALTKSSVNSAAEKAGQEHCASMLAQDHYPAAVQNACHKATAEERATQIQNLNDDCIWPE